jgi:signal transduction histidine kinase
MLASDQKEGPENPSGLARKMLDLEEVILSEWERRVRIALKEAGSLPHPILANTVPRFYENLVEALSPDYPRTAAEVGGPAIASEHGGERARLTRYGSQDVIAEYQILRETIVDVLRQNGCEPSNEEFLLMGAAFDSAIREAAAAFELVQASFREQFVATVVHDIRNPLATAHNGVELVPYITDPQALKAHIKKVLEHLSRVDRMLGEVLDTVTFKHGARLALDLTYFDMDELVREVCRESSASTEERLVITGPSIKGWWDRDYIKRAVENLVGNALKYGLDSEPIRIAFIEHDGRLALSVRNEGDPIPLNQTETIFQAFSRSSAAKANGRRGWGIGLPFVRSVAECHGGSIDLDSTKERGTTFTIDIPVDCRPFQNAPTLG